VGRHKPSVQEPDTGPQTLGTFAVMKKVWDIFDPRPGCPDTSYLQVRIAGSLLSPVDCVPIDLSQLWPQCLSITLSYSPHNLSFNFGENSVLFHVKRQPRISLLSTLVICDRWFYVNVFFAVAYSLGLQIWRLRWQTLIPVTFLQ